MRLDLERDRTACFAADLEMSSGHLVQRANDVLTLLRRSTNHLHACQIACVNRCRDPLKTEGDDRETGCTETVYVITWLDVAAASSGDLLLMNRGRRAVDGRVPRTLDNAATWNEGRRQIRGSMATMARTASLNASCRGMDRLTSLHRCM